MLSKVDGDTYHCDVCGTQFSRNGKIVDPLQENH